MSWKRTKVNIYRNHADKVGREVTIEQAILTECGPNLRDLSELRNLDRLHPSYEEHKRAIKNRLQCFTLCLLEPGRTKVKHPSGLLQIDFDKKDCESFDLEELKYAVFNLPFVAFCGLSCSGEGFYAIAAISEPERQKEYAEHIFQTLSNIYGITCDKSKGRNPNDLRYVSTDNNLLMKEVVDPLHIQRFQSKPDHITKTHRTLSRSIKGRKTDNHTESQIIASQLRRIKEATKGSRWHSVQKASYTMGGIASSNLGEIFEEIHGNPAFAGEELKYAKCASVCFHAGRGKMIII